MSIGIQFPIRQLLSIAACVVILTASCAQLPGLPPLHDPAAVPTEQPTETPEPASAPAAAAAFLERMTAGDYQAMHALLSPESQAALDAESFTRRYQNALSTATVITVTTELDSVLSEGERATAAYKVTLDTLLFGALSAESTMSLRLYGRAWRVDWDAGLIWPQLARDNYFRTTYRVPVRGDIYDRHGLALATQGRLVTVGVVPGQIQDETAVLQTLASITGLAAETVRARYASSNPEWKVPIADISADASVEHNDALASLAGVYREEKVARTYPYGDAAGHIVGWVAPLPAEQLAEYRSLGYQGDEKVGVAGLEGWGESTLAGRHGGTLSVVTALGGPVAEVSRRDAHPGRPIYTTIDRDFQAQTQHLLRERKGAIVVLDVHSGAVRALASGPGLDPNLLAGPPSAAGRSEILSDPRQPLFNRATQGTYPTGSVFKIVTMAAGLEAAEMDPLASVFSCPGYWDGLGAAARKYCWRPAGHGQITLQDALTASCNVTFYSVGKTLHELDPSILPRFGAEFGLGQPTRLAGLAEDVGLMPDPEWKVGTLGEAWYPGDTVNLAIGQGYLRVTPLQVASMMAAVANGGTLYQPFIVERIGGSEWGEEEVVEPQVVGSLRISAAHLRAMQEGLLGVTTASPLGTATRAFAGLDIPVAGKTGTAEVGIEGVAPHSWFAAYAPADEPEIAIVIIVENAGEGSTVAAPLVRQVVEAYYGMPVSDLPPEAEEDYVAPTPTPEP